jgi:hypothetical protein
LAPVAATESASFLPYCYRSERGRAETVQAYKGALVRNKLVVR